MLTKESLAAKIIVVLKKQSQKAIASDVETSQKEIASDLADAIIQEIRINGRCKIVIGNTIHYGTIE